MQIHELNNFNGTPGATNFLAIDDGSDTSRISGEALLDPVNSRIDNLTANVLPDSVETILDWADVESASKTLTKNVSEFDYLDLYFKEVTSGTNRIVFAQRYPRTAFPAQVTIPVISWGGGTDPKYLYFQDLMIAISGTTLTMSQLRIYSWDGKAADGANINTGILVDQIRVDGVKISSNTSAELTDLRTAHNGTVYASARAAREADYNALENQVVDLKDETSILGSALFEDIAPLTPRASTEGYSISDDGKAIQDANCTVKSYNVTPGNVIKVVTDVRFQFQNEPQLHSDRPSPRIGKTYGPSNGYFIVPEGAHFLFMSTYSNNGIGAVYYVSNNIETVKKQIGILTGEVNLDTVAYGEVTYRELFESNNKIRYGDFENGLPSGAIVNAGNPYVTSEESVSRSHSLKCFGSSSTQIVFRDIVINPNYDYGVFYVACKVKVDRYASGGGAGFSSSVPMNPSGYAQKLVTDTGNKWETVSETFGWGQIGEPYHFYFGTVSAANCDAYVDDAVVINLHDVFGSDDIGIRPSKAQMDALYDIYIKIKNYNYLNAKAEEVDEINDNIQNGKLLVGAVLDAASETDRFLAMNQLFMIANKKLKNPDVIIDDNEFNKATNGIVCALPDYSPAMFQNYNFNILYQKNSSVQSIPASTSKVMALITGLDYITNIKEYITILSADVQTGSGNYFNAGDKMTIEDLIYGMLLPSSNTCAMAFARVSGEKILKLENPSGTFTPAECVTAFVNHMNIKASLIGMSSSTFVSPSGLSEDNKATASDLLRMTVEACSYSSILKIWNKKAYTINVKGSNPRSVDLATTVTNSTLEQNFYIIGGKTGHLPNANALVMVGKLL